MRDLAAPFRAIVTGLRRLRDHSARSRRLQAMRSAHHRQRVVTIQAELSRTASGFVFITGDSNAALLGEPHLDRPVVNGGIGATLANEVAGLLKNLKFDTRASVAVIIIGQNETLTANGPMSRFKKARFLLALSQIERFLKSRADLIVFSAVPPPHRLAADTRDPVAFDFCSTSVRAFCAGGRCVFVDLFEDVRSEDVAFLRDTTPMDESGVHLADYGQVRRRLASVIEALSSDEGLGPARSVAKGRAAGDRQPKALSWKPTTKTEV